MPDKQPEHALQPIGLPPSPNCSNRLLPPDNSNLLPDKIPFDLHVELLSFASSKISNGEQRDHQ
jgi:hypothetical protein